MPKESQGFTLIELMIVVAIIGILAAIAVPQYQNYVARTQTSESIVMMDAAKIMIEDYVSFYGNFPNNKASLIALDIKITGTYGSITGVNNPNGAGGNIVYKTTTTKINKNIQNSSIWFNREENTGAWSCHSDLPDKYRPKGCKESISTPTGS